VKVIVRPTDPPRAVIASRRCRVTKATSSRRLERWKHDVRIVGVIRLQSSEPRSGVSDRLFGRIDTMFEMMGGGLST